MSQATSPIPTIRRILSQGTEFQNMQTNDFKPEFTAAIEKTRAELHVALRHHYPVDGNNDVQEAMTVSYLGYALRELGFLTYPCHQIKGQPQEHFDLAAIHRDKSVMLLAEGKRLYNGQKAGELGNDWLRIKNLKLAGWGQQIRSQRCYACLLATTWHPEIRNWWSSTNRSATPNGRRDSSHWLNLKDALGQAVIASADPIHQWTEYEAWQEYNALFLLTALIEMPSESWTEAN